MKEWSLLRQEPWRKESRLALFPKLFLLGLIPYALLEGDRVVAIFALVGVTICCLPLFLQRWVRLPKACDPIVSGLFTFHVFVGGYLRFYERYLYDKAIHLNSSSILYTMTALRLHNLCLSPDSTGRSSSLRAIVDQDDGRCIVYKVYTMHSIHRGAND